SNRLTQAVSLLTWESGQEIKFPIRYQEFEGGSCRIGHMLVDLFGSRIISPAAAPRRLALSLAA
ncbi:MAG: hypothetical protein ACK565_05345, partial [Pirellulaceae bacterium]